MTTTVEHEAPQKCALEYYDSGNFVPYLQAWWAFMLRNPAHKQTVLDWLFGAYIILHKNEFDVYTELTFLRDLIHNHPEVYK